MAAPKPTYRISGADVDGGDVQNRLQALTYAHLRPAIENIAASPTNVVNMQNYLLTCLYNAQPAEKTAPKNKFQNYENRKWDYARLAALNDAHLDQLVIGN